MSVIFILLALGFCLSYLYVKLVIKYDQWGLLLGLFVIGCIPSFSLSFIVGYYFKIRDIYFPFAFSIPFLMFGLVGQGILLLPIGLSVLLFGKMGNHLGYKKKVVKSMTQKEEEPSIIKQVEATEDSDAASGTSP